MVRAPPPRRDVRRARQRALRSAARARGVRRGGARRRHRGGHGRDRDRAGGARVAVARRPAQPDRRRGPSRPGRRARDPRAGGRRSARASRSGRAFPFEDLLDTDEGWAKYNAALLAARLRGVPAVLLRRGVHRGPFDEADRRRRRLGPRDRPRDADRDATARPGLSTRRDPRALRPRPMPGPRDPGHRRRDHGPDKRDRAGRRDPGRRGSRRSKAAATSRTPATRSGRTC